MNLTKEQTQRFIESLLLLCQDSAEHGDLPAEIYADMFELTRELTAVQIRTEAAA